MNFSFDSRFSQRFRLDAGRHLHRTILRHLSSADLTTLADNPTRAHCHSHRVDHLAGHNESRCHPLRTETCRQRR